MGTATHEYGHFALCHLVREHGAYEPADFVLTLETVSQGDPDPPDETRVTNEVFADFFAVQVANAPDYFEVVGKDTLPSGRVVVGLPGADQNMFAFPTVNTPSALSYGAVGRLATLIQDAFDGNFSRDFCPNSGDGWTEILPFTSGTTNVIVPSLLPNGLRRRSVGHNDEEQAALSGFYIGDMVRRMVEINNVTPYRYQVLETAVAQTVRDELNWCQACLVLAPHFSPGGKNVREQIEQCVKQDLLPECPEGTVELGNPSCGSLRDRLGDPQMDPLLRDAFTCDPCPEGQVMRSDGHCGRCPIDVVLDVASEGLWTCDEVALNEVSNPGDLCPNVFVIEVLDPNHELASLSVELGVSPSLPEESCSEARFSGDFGRNYQGPLAPLVDMIAFQKRATFTVCDPEAEFCGDEGCLIEAQSFQDPGARSLLTVQSVHGPLTVRGIGECIID